MQNRIPVDCSLLSLDTNRQLTTQLASLCDSLDPVLKKYPLQPLLDALYQACHPTIYEYLPPEALQIFDGIENEFGKETLGKYNKAATIHLIVGVDKVISSQNLPQAFLDLWPLTLETTCQYLSDTPDQEYVYPKDFYLKDVRILTGRAISYGAYIIDTGVFLPKSIYRMNGWRRNLECLWFILTRTKGLGPFYRSHLDHRHTDHLTESLYVDYHISLGALLERHTEVRGLVGTGWLEDPHLATLTPRRAYKHRIGKENKVFVRYDGPAEIHTQRAILKSKTRREAYEKGEYMPASYTTIWPRKEMIKWARDQKHKSAK